MPQPHLAYHIVTAVMHDGDRLVMVQEQNREGTASQWALPGGVAEPGESLPEALVREVREETGLEVVDPGRVLYVVYVDEPAHDYRVVIFAFEVAAWRGELRPVDPDGLVRRAEFRPIPEVAEQFAQLDAVRSRPLLCYLRGEAQVGALWSYRQGTDGVETMTVCPALSPPSPAPPRR